MKEFAKWVGRKWLLWLLIGLFIWGYFYPDSFFKMLNRSSKLSEQVVDSTEIIRKNAIKLKEDAEKLAPKNPLEKKK